MTSRSGSGRDLAAPGRMIAADPCPRELVGATVEPDIVKIPARVALAIDGAGPPGDSGFQTALQALYGATYTLKFARKKAGKPTFKVGALEGKWSAVTAGSPPPPNTWRWRLRLTVPRDVTAAELRAVLATKRGKLADNPLADAVFVEKIPAARMGRILHVGPYADEPATFDRLAPLIARERPSPWHLEVYLGDPRRVAPAKLRTVLFRELAPAKRAARGKPGAISAHA